MKSTLVGMLLLACLNPPLTALAGEMSFSAGCSTGMSAGFQGDEPDLRPKTLAHYVTKPMKESAQGENIKIITHGVLIHYMDAAERERDRVVIFHGQVFSSTGEKYPDSASGDVINYVMDAAGNFYLFNQKGHPELRHSSFFAGGQVAGAGELTIADGTVSKINFDSGHYHPSAEMIANVLAELRADGVNISAFRGN